MRILKDHLFHRYGGFADERVTDLDLRDTFIVDERRRAGLPRPVPPSDTLCRITARVIDHDAVEVVLAGNVPKSAGINRWVKKHADVASLTKAQLTFRVTLATAELLTEIADIVAAIVASDAPGYADPTYKFVCPSTSDSLRKLRRELADCPPTSEPPSTLDMFS